MQEIIDQRARQEAEFGVEFASSRDRIRANLERAYENEQRLSNDAQEWQDRSEQKLSEQRARFQAAVERETEKVAALVDRAQLRAEGAAQRALQELEAAGQQSEARHAAQQTYYRELFKEWSESQEPKAGQSSDAKPAIDSSAAGESDGGPPLPGEVEDQTASTSTGQAAPDTAPQKPAPLGPKLPGHPQPTAEEHFMSLVPALHPAELDDLNNQRLLNELIPDGGRAYTTGYHNVPPGEAPDDLIQVLGIRVEPHVAQASAEILSRATKRPVTNIMNHSAISQHGGLIGSAEDAKNAALDRTFVKDPAREAAQETVRLETLSRLLRGESATFVVHSQGSVITQRGLSNALGDIDRMLAMNQITAEEHNVMLRRIRVVAVGAFAHRDGWDKRIAVDHANNPDDLVAILGGNISWRDLRAPDTTFKSHGYEGYIPAASDALKDKPE